MSRPFLSQKWNGWVVDEMLLLAIIVRRFKKNATTIGWLDDSFQIEDDVGPVFSAFYLWLEKILAPL